MPHDPILIGTEFGAQPLEFSEPSLENLLALPGFISFLSNKFYAQAEAVEEQIRQEQISEIDEDIDLFWDDSLSTASYFMDTEAADELERRAATIDDPVERKTLLQEARRIRAAGRDQERLLARGSARENARTRALNKLHRKDRLGIRAERQKYAHNLRLAANALLQGIPEQKPVVATSWALDRHACIFGATGFGKSRLIRQLLTEQLRAGHSAIIIDPKPEALEDMISSAIEAGVPPEDVILLTPKNARTPVPGWNPLIRAVDPEIAARTVRALLLILDEGWGPRMTNILTNALNIMAAHRLSLTECSAFLTSERYRQALLETQPEGDFKSYRQSVRFFREDFNNWPASAKDESVRAVKTRLSDLLEIPFISALLCSRTNTLNLGELWSKQKVIIAHLDVSTLLPEGARIISLLIAYQTYLTAMEVGATGTVPVTLVLDELGTQEKFLGESLSDIITFSRSQGLRLMVATQHFTKVSPPLLDALLGNARLQVFFQLGEKDARTISGNLAAATIAKNQNDEAAVCVGLSTDTGTEIWRLRICNEVGATLNPLQQVQITAGVTLPSPDYSSLRPRPDLPKLTEPRRPVPTKLSPPIIPAGLQDKIKQIEQWEKRIEELNEQNDDISLVTTSFRTYREAHIERIYQDNGTVLYKFEEETRRISAPLPQNPVPPPAPVPQGFNWFGLRPTPPQKLTPAPTNPIGGHGTMQKSMTGLFISREEDELIQELMSLPSRQKAVDERYQHELAKYNIELAKYNKENSLRREIISEWNKERDKITRKNQELCSKIIKNAENTYFQKLEDRINSTYHDHPFIADVYFGLHKRFFANDFYVQVDSGGRIKLADFLIQLIRCNPEGIWPKWQIHGSEIWVTIPKITVSNVTNRDPMGKSEWERAVQIIPAQHIVVRTTESANDMPTVCQTRVVRVEDPLKSTDPRFQEFVRRAYAANGITYEEITESELWRENQIDNLIEKARINTRSVERSTAAKPQTEVDDSI